MHDNITVRVWDPLVRICHWSLVGLFAIAYLTGEGEGRNALHIYSGYTVIGLVAIRILWGLIGSQHAKFKDFIFSPYAVIQYLRSVVRGDPKRYLGHNPAGGYMALLLLIMLLVVTATGLKAYGVKGYGPLAHSTRIAAVSVASAGEHRKIAASETNNAEDEFWKEMHEAASNVTLFLIALHVLGVIASSVLHRENLAKAMITGEKQVRLVPE